VSEIVCFYMEAMQRGAYCRTG